MAFRAAHACHRRALRVYLRIEVGTFLTENYPLLNSIRSIEDFRRIPDASLDALAAELRAYMIETVSKTGGHLASSLGAVEIIIAMHRVFDSPKDRLVFDVGHQAYAHKILTGRKDAFPTLRQKDGLSGFPKRSESEHDVFDTGHASTSVSAALGMARAMQLRHEDGTAVALIGDGAMTGGLALEGMNDAGQANVPLIVILNDNDMSISPNVGSIHRQLTNMRMSRGYVRFKRRIVRLLDTGPIGRLLSKRMESFKNRIKNFLLPHQLFEEMGFTYLGPIDGHDTHELIRVLTRARALSGAVLIHAITKKGKGYRYAEENPERFHGVSRFDVSTGMTAPAKRKSNSEVFGDTLLTMAGENAGIVAVTAAMPLGTGLNRFAMRYPERLFDVGIAEEHAVTMAAGMAAAGLHPVVAIYSSFLQRAYDELLHDVCLQKLPVVFAVDRAGLVGEDGETHQGIYDIAYLSTLPGMRIYSPATQQELSAMLEMAVLRAEPAAIRYNRGSLMQALIRTPVEFGKWCVIRPIAAVTVVATGCMVEEAFAAVKDLDVGLVNARFLSPMDEDILNVLREACRHVVTVEDGIVSFGDRVALRLMPVRVTRLGVPNEAIRQGTVAAQRAYCGLRREDIIRAVQEEI